MNWARKSDHTASHPDKTTKKRERTKIIDRPSDPPTDVYNAACETGRQPVNRLSSQQTYIRLYLYLYCICVYTNKNTEIGGNYVHQVYIAENEITWSIATEEWAEWKWRQKKRTRECIFLFKGDTQEEELTAAQKEPVRTQGEARGRKQTRRKNTKNN